MSSENNTKKENIGKEKVSNTASAKVVQNKKPDSAEALKRKKRAKDQSANVNKGKAKNGSASEANIDSEILPTVSSVKKKIDVEKARKAAERNKKPKLILTFDSDI